MKIMLDFQWTCILISVMSGAAGWPGFLSGDDDGEDDDGAGRVSEWLESMEAFKEQLTAVSDP